MRVLTAERLRDLLSYDPATGAFQWREHLGSLHSQFAGTVAGHRKRADGYVYVRIDGRGYLAHRLAWLYVHGHWPAGMLDHRNTDRADNRIGNLRQATNSANLANSHRRSDNTSGFKGVSRDKGGKWQAYVTKDGCRRFLGLFATPQDAHAAYIAAATKLHGAFARAS